MSGVQPEVTLELRKNFERFSANPLFLLASSFLRPIYPPLSSRPHTSPRKSASNGIPGAHRVSGGSVGVRAGGAAVALLGDEPLSPGPWRRLATRMWRVRNGLRSRRKANDLAFRMTNARSHSEGLERDKSAGGAHWLRHEFTNQEGKAFAPRVPTLAEGRSLTMARCESRRGDDEMRASPSPLVGEGGRPEGEVG
jgi:hypothetical protein